MKNTAITITGSGKICAVIDGKSYTVDKTHRNYTAILGSVKEKDYTAFVSLVDMTTPVRNYITQSSSTGLVAINDGVITYDGEVIHNMLTDRILTFAGEGLPFEPLMRFFENLMQNPSKASTDELYAFLEAGELPLTEDGCFLAFKNVQGTYFSIRGNAAIKPIHGTSDAGGHILNAVGEYIEIRRNQVCEDKNTTCASGLHFCSIKYLPSYEDTNGGKTMVLKINPKDVVSIPTDYDNAKGRCCAYTVVAEYQDDWRGKCGRGESGFDEPLYSSKDGQIYGVKPSGQKFWNVRGSNGKFVKQG